MSKHHYDLAIVGAGAGGLACAIAASDAGAKVCLVEKSTRLGGTVTHSLIHTLGGLYDDTGAYINPGLPVELAERLLKASPQTYKRNMGKVWVLNVNPAVYGRVLEDWVASKANITVLHNTSVTALKTAGKRVTGVDISQETVEADAFVDATGTAEVVRMLDASKVLTGNALAGLIFQIRGIAADSLLFPKNLGLRRSVQVAVEAGTLPRIFTSIWFDIGVQEDEAYAKLNLPAQEYSYELAESWQIALANFLRKLPGFSNVRIIRGELGIRDGGRIQGEYCLTVADIKNAPPVLDPAGRCAWPIEYWQAETGVSLDYLPPGHTYTIPISALKVANMENLWAVGKCLSSEKAAQASARVAGSCWAMGEALGKALANVGHK